MTTGIAEGATINVNSSFHTLQLPLSSHAGIEVETLVGDNWDKGFEGGT